MSLPKSIWPIALIGFLSSSVLLAQTASNNRPRIDGGGLGTEGRCQGNADGVGPPQLRFSPSGPSPGGRDVPTATNGPTTPSGVRTQPGQTASEPAYPAASGDTVRLDGSVSHTFAVPAPLGIGDFTPDHALLLRSHTASDHSAGSAVVGFGDSLHLTMFDRVVEVGEDPSQFVWISGTGDATVFSEYSAGTQPVDLSGSRWFRADHNYALSRFRLFQHPTTQEWTLDRHRPDGGVMRYQYVSSAGSWRPITFFDSYDNRWQYAWIDPVGPSKPAWIEDPRGVRMTFNWSTGSMGMGSDALTVSYSRGATSFPGLTWGLETDAQGRLHTLTLPATEYVRASNVTLLDLAQPVTDARILEFTYDGSGQLDEIRDLRESGFVVRKYTWVSAWGTVGRRVDTIVDELGLVHRFGYLSDPANQEISRSTYA